MTVIIPHSTEELKLIQLQKELITIFFEKDRIITASYPLWIELGDFELTEKEGIKKIELGDLIAGGHEILCPVKIECKGKTLSSKLPLVSIYKGPDFSEEEKKIMAEKKQPVKLIKVFRLGIVADEGPHAKSISKSVWCKLHHTRPSI